nr:synaptobrevin, longin-like domain protein [Tanacetum cinerariifolium]
MRVEGFASWEIGQEHMGMLRERCRRDLEITYSCFHGFINKDLINLVIPDVRRYVVVLTGTSKYWGVLRILMISLRLIPLFYDYHNMVAILEKSEHNVDFHPIVDFIEASPLRIETTKEGTKILATVDGNISPNQKFTFQKGQFSHQWKYLIHTIMQCMSPKSTGFNEFSSNIATALVCLATNRLYNFSKIIFDDEPASLLRDVSEGVAAEISRDDTPIKGRNLEEGEAAAERVSDDTEEMETVLTFMDAVTVLASGVAEVPTGSGSIPTVGPPAAE